MSNAENILKEAKQSIIRLIGLRLRRIVGFKLSGDVRLAIAEDQDCEIYAEELNRPVYVLTEENCADETKAYHRVTKIVCANGRLGVYELYDAEKCKEVLWDDIESINVEDLVNICSALEEVYCDITGKKL